MVRSGVAPMEQAMIGPSDEKGTVVIRTIFGVIAADERNLDRSLEELLADPEACEAIGLEGGPFCYIEPWLSIPF